MEPTDNIVPLAENLFWIKAPGRGKFPYCNGFLLTGRQTMLIDAGIGEDRIREIDSRQRIDCLLISHSHPDHILKWHLLKDRHIIMPAEIPDVVTDLLQLGERFAGAKNASDWKKRVGDAWGLIPMRLPDRRYHDGEIIDLGDISLEAIHAPGHLNDHYCFLVRECGVLLTTDIDFDSFGPWYGNPESDIDLFKQSIQKVRGFPFELVCSSHKFPIAKQNSQQAFDNYLAIFDRQKQLIIDQCAQPKSLSTLAEESPIYRNKMPDRKVQMIFETQMIRKILNQLLREGSVQEADGVFSLVN